MSSSSDDFIAESSEISADPSATETDDDDDDEVPVQNIRQSKRARRPTKTQSFSSSSYDPIAVSRPRRNVEKPVSYEDPGSSSFDERIGDSEDEEEVVEEEEAASSEEDVDEGVERGEEEEEEDDDDEDAGSDWVAVKGQASSTNTTKASSRRRQPSGKSIHDDPNSPKGAAEDYNPDDTPRSKFDMQQFWVEFGEPYFGELDGIAAKEVQARIQGILTSMEEEYGGSLVVDEDGQLTRRNPYETSVQILDIQKMIRDDIDGGGTYIPEVRGGNSEGSGGGSSNDDDDDDDDDDDNHSTSGVGGGNKTRTIKGDILSATKSNVEDEDDDDDDDDDSFYDDESCCSRRRRRRRTTRSRGKSGRKDSTGS